MTDRIAGLYAITDPQLTPGDTMLAAAEAALRGGARLLQYRDKLAEPATRTRRALQLAALCRSFDALFFVNDDAELAAQAGADGVHLGQDDGAVAKARALLGEHKLIGVSCHGDLNLATQAAAEGADYVALGRFFPSRTKPQAPPADIATLAEARRRLPLPLVAIGGITADNASPLLTAGADAVAIIQSLFGADDVEAAARRFTALFRN